MIRKIINIICLLIILIPIVYWGAYLLRCELLTLQYGKEFNTVYRQNTMMGDINYLKVLDYSDENARVYYVSKNRSGGDILKFIKEDDKWIYEEWEKTVWSSTGSASEVIWPYWWDFIYGGF